MVSSGGVFGPARVAPPSCSVTGTHLYQLSGSCGAFSGVNQSQWRLEQADVGAMPETLHTTALTMPGGTWNLSGNSVSPGMSRRAFNLGSLYTFWMKLCQMGAAPIAPATCDIGRPSLLPTHTPTDSAGV